ncbi:unnamed protein product [Hapterophycus canaliculatus]
MSLINRGSSFEDQFRRMNDMFRSMEQEMLAPWGLASRFPMFPALSGGGMLGDTRYLNLDFHETKEGFELIADLPGMTQDDISVDVDTESGVLTVSGERKEEREEKGEGEGGEKKYHFVERSYGKMARSIRLPETADVENANAGYEAGVLTITFPKRNAPAPHRLQIPVSGTAGSDVKVSIEGGGSAAKGGK